MWLLGSFAWASGLGLVDLEPTHLRVATSSEVAPERVPVPGPWRLVGAVGGVRSYEAALPVRPRALFFSSAPDGMTVQRAGNRLKYGGQLADAGRAGTWAFTADSVVVRVAADAPAPDDDDVSLGWPSARDREQALHLGAAAAWTDVVRSAQVHDVSRRGVYLPVPSEVSWTVKVPEGGVLRLVPGVLPPEMAGDGTRSDGADLEVRVGDAHVATVRVGEFAEARVPLGAWAGGEVTLTLATSDASPARDHVFVGEPQIYVPDEHPRRTLLVFIDTLRRDHLGVYGATRGASPTIDAFARGAVTFDDARSVAPWTLPSTRSALTGRQPEAWTASPTLPERLSALGWATAAYVGNVYLSSNFDMARGWGEHGVVNWPSATFEVERARRFLDAHADQDALLMVHFMDMHLPYKEPWRYRRLYVDGDLPGLGGSFVRGTLLKYAKGRQEQVRTYLQGRYDQNLRFIDDQLARLFRMVGDDATVVLFADHGEEFFDHGDLEHGHTLYDELLRVPLLVRSPDLEPTVVRAPVSLLDLAPTVLDLHGLAHDGLDGRSLLPLARGLPGAVDLARPIAFGRPLYGDRAWGVVQGGAKYTARSGLERLFDLAADPGETTNLLDADTDATAFREAMAAGTAAPVRLGFRVTTTGQVHAPGATLHVPGGIEVAWVGDDPTQKSRAELECVDDETVRASFTGNAANMREVFVIPRRPADEVVAEVSVEAGRAEPTLLLNRPTGGTDGVLAKLALQGRSVLVTWAVTPLPVGESTVGFDPEQAAALKALGYVDEAPSAPTGDAAALQRCP